MNQIVFLTALFALVVIPDSSGRSITVVVNHRASFAVPDSKLLHRAPDKIHDAFFQMGDIEITERINDTKEQQFIKLSKFYEDELKLGGDEKVTKETEVATETLDVAKKILVPEVRIGPTNIDSDTEVDHDELQVNTDDDDYVHNKSSTDDTGDEFYFENETVTTGDTETDENTSADKNAGLVVADISDEDESLDRTAGSKGHVIRKRTANEQWKQSKFGKKIKNHERKNKKDEPDIWEEVTDEDLENAAHWKYKQLAEYIGVTVLSVSGFILIGYCFIRDPVACIFAFGTGCPCCLICCPCVRKFTDKYLDVKRLVRDSLNKYMPGIIVLEDGSLQHYEATAEEIEILAEIVCEIAEV